MMVQHKVRPSMAAHLAVRVMVLMCCLMMMHPPQAIEGETSGNEVAYYGSTLLIMSGQM